MKLNICFGIQFEKNRIKTTLSKLNWYKSQGYKVDMPKGIDEKSSDEKIILKVKSQFKEKDYQDYASALSKEFLLIKKGFYNALKKTFRGQKIPLVVDVYLTKYGVGGSYNLPNMIIKNITHPKPGIKTTVHEIIHLIIEPSVQKFKIDHWEKERIVDLILNSREFGFLKYDYWQYDYHGVEKYMDPFFNKHFFKDPIGFFSKIPKKK